MSTNPKPAGHNRPPKRPMIADLAGYHTAAAVEVAQTLLDEDGFYPGDVTAAARAVTAVADWTKANRIAQISDLTGDVVERMLLETTGAGSLQPMDPYVADALHLHRNTISMLRFAVLLARPSVVTKRSHRPGADTIAAGLPQIGPRTGYRLRPLRDDEVILPRMLTALDLREEADLLPLHNYVVSEAGMAPMEVTEAATDHLTWEEETATGITASGVRRRGRRLLRFDPWQQHILSITLPQYLSSGRRYLAYAGLAPGTKDACASTSPTLMRFLRRAGIAGSDLSGGSVALWRCDHTIQTRHDLTAARAIAGSTAELLLKNLHYTVDEINVHRGVATLVSLDTRPDVHIAAGQVQGIGSWTDDEDNPGTLRRRAA